MLPNLHWPDVLALSLALLVGFLLLDAYLKIRRSGGSHQKSIRSESTTEPGRKIFDAHMPRHSLMPPPRVITHSTGLPPWEQPETWLKTRTAPLVKEELERAFLRDAQTTGQPAVLGQELSITSRMSMPMPEMSQDGLRLARPSIKSDLTLPAGAIHSRGLNQKILTMRPMEKTRQLTLF